jgi:PAS domain S-box-containing protein
MLTDEIGRILWVNNGFTKVTEFAMEEVVGKYPSEILCGPETDVETKEAIVRAINEKSKYRGEILNYTKSGKKFWVYIDITPIYNDAGDVVKFIAVENDITAIKEAEKKLMDNLEQERKLSELKSRFVTLTSHEFRTPLGSIQTSKDIIQLILKREQVAISDQLNQQFKKIDSQIERISRVMNNILVLGRIDAGRISFKPKLGSIEGLISNVLEEEYLQFQTNTVQPIFLVNGAPRELRIDFELMDFIVRNLISNGFKYGNPEKPLTVSIHYMERFVQIEVIDKGIGIPEEDQPFIFHSFFRAKNAEHIIGTGLGLILVKQFVEMHKGSINFKTILSQGATFTIRLPYNEEN